MKSNYPSLLSIHGLFLTALLAGGFLVQLRAQESEHTDAVLALFEKKCQECHHEDTDDESPYLHGRVSVADLIDEEAIVVGKPDESPIYKRIMLADSARKRMPKSKGAPKEDLYRDSLSADEKALIKDWIESLGKGPETLTTSEATSAPPKEKKQPKEETVIAAASADDAISEEASLEEKVGFILDRNCRQCHNPKKRRQPFLSSTEDLAALVRDGKAQSIFEKVTLPVDDPDRMPPSDGTVGDPDFVAPLSREEQDILGQWVKGGGSDERKKREPVYFTEMIRTIYEDVRENEIAAKYYRYFTLTNLYNAVDKEGFAEVDDNALNSYRAGISKLINSLSTGGKVVPPQAIDEEETIYRIDLRHYDWTPEQWEEVVGSYPHGILGIDGQKERQIKKYTGSEMAYLRADWFAFAAAQPPLYDEIMAGLLEIDDLSAEGAQQRMEDALGVTRVENLKHGDAIRAGFIRSGVSDHNRLIERHESDYGAYWVSYDFKRVGAGAPQDLRRAPMGPVEALLTTNKDHVFDHDGGEMIYRLPNGLQGYFLATADGKRLDRAPSDIVRDSNRPDGTIINGVSCIKCHESGMKPAIKVDLGLPPGQSWNEATMGPNPQTLKGMTDEIGPFILESGILSFDEKTMAEQLYPSPEELRRVVMLDFEDFKEANEIATMGLATKGVEPVSALYDSYFTDSVDALRLSSELGMDHEELLEFIEEESFESEGIRTLFLSLQKGDAEPRDQILQEWMSIVPILGYEVMPYEPLGYEEFGGKDFAGLIRESPAFVALFGEGTKPVQKTAAAAKEAVTKSDAALKAQSTQLVLLPGGGKMNISVEPKLNVGDKGGLKIQSEEDVYVRVMHFSADDKVTQFFPNDVNPNNLVKALGPNGGRNTKTIPFLATANEGEAAGKGGGEYFVVFASSEEIGVNARGEKVGGFEIYDRKDFFSSRGVATALAATDTETAKKKVPATIVEGKVGYLLVE